MNKDMNKIEIEKNIYLFWLGEHNEKVQLLSKKITEFGFKVIIGPTSEEHSFLLKSLPYYRHSYESGLFSYCSDVWRAYKLMSNVGMYIDTTVEIGEKFIDFYFDAMKSNTYVFKESYGFIGSAIMASSIKNNPIFTELFNVFKQLNSKYVSLYEICPVFLTNIVSKYEINNWETLKNDEIFIDILPSVRNVEKIFKKGSGSWMIKKSKNWNYNDSWKILEEQWKNGIKRDKFLWRVDLIKRFGYEVIDIYYLRNLYDISSKNERSEIDFLYKKLPYRNELTIFDKLFWSKLYILFNKK